MTDDNDRKELVSLRRDRAKLSEQVASLRYNLLEQDKRIRECDAENARLVAENTELKAQVERLVAAVVTVQLTAK